MSHYATFQPIASASVSRPGLDTTSPVRQAQPTEAVWPRVLAVLAAVMMVLLLCVSWVAAQGWTQRGLDRAAGVPVASLIVAHPAAS